MQSINRKFQSEKTAAGKDCSVTKKLHTDTVVMFLQLWQNNAKHVHTDTHAQKTYEKRNIQKLCQTAWSPNITAIPVM